MRATRGRHCVRLGDIFESEDNWVSGTISSGSSGHRVTAPEPLCSIVFLIRRIVGAGGSPRPPGVGSSGGS
jgi:hypothetical protein